MQRTPSHYPPPVDGKSTTVSSTSTPAAHHQFFSEQFGYVGMPERRQCQRTFEFLGFTPEGAMQRWRTEQLLASNPSTNPQSRLDTMLELLPDRIGLDYQEYFSSYQICQELQDAIMDPCFADIRGTAGPGYWVRDSICGRIRVLEDYFMRRRYRPDYEPLAPLRRPRGSISYTGDDVVLYKGVSSWRTAQLADVTNPTRISLSYLLKHEPKRGDFSRNSDGLYFTPQKELATRFAEYSTHRTHGIPSSRLLTMRVPRSFLNTYDHRELWVDDVKDAWRKTVKLCRFSFFYTRRGRDFIPPNLANMLNHNDYLIGNVSTGHEGAPIRSPRGLESYKSLGPSNVLHVQRADGKFQRAVQWKFGKDIVEPLQQCIGVGGEGCIGVEIPYPGPPTRQARNDSWSTTEQTHTDPPDEVSPTARDSVIE